MTTVTADCYSNKKNYKKNVQKQINKYETIDLCKYQRTMFPNDIDNIVISLFF